MFDKSDNIAELAAALSKFQAECPAVPKSSRNPFLKNKYASLDNVVNYTRAALTNNGLSVSQMPLNEGQLVTILMHSSGQYISGVCEFRQPEFEKGKSLAQLAGSTITYQRRYAYAAILGIVSDEDTDGNDGTPVGRAQAKKAAANKPAPKKEDNTEVPKRLEAALIKKGKTKAEAIEIVKPLLSIFDLEVQKTESKKLFKAHS
jgi:hypothetical protein